MKRNFKKTGLILALAIMLIFSTTVTALAEDTTTTGQGDASTPIPIEGTIEALTVSVTHPITVSYAIEPNDGDTEGIIAPEILLVNNTLVPIKVTVESMFSTSGGSLQFTDVLPTDKDWANLNVADSKQYIALGIKIPSALEWGPGYDTGTYYAAEMSLVEFGTLNSNSTGVLTLVASHGLAFDEVCTSKHSLFFIFSLV